MLTLAMLPEASWYVTKRLQTAEWTDAEESGS